MATGSIGFASMAASANSGLPGAVGGLLDGAAGDPGFAAASSVIASSAASPVRLNPADLPVPSKDAVLSASKPVSPPHPDSDAAIRTAAMRVACTIRLRHYVRTTKGDQASVPGDSSPSEETVKILISPEQPARFGRNCG
jgi:hypothetical protein